MEFYTNKLDLKKYTYTRLMYIALKFPLTAKPRSSHNNAQCMLMFSEQVVEGAAGVVIGGYMANAEKFHDKTVALVSCGANIDTKTLISIIT